jgi:hypothetical protein
MTPPPEYLRGQRYWHELAPPCRQPYEQAALRQLMYVGFTEPDYL